VCVCVCVCVRERERERDRVRERRENYGYSRRSKESKVVRIRQRTQVHSYAADTLIPKKEERVCTPGRAQKNIQKTDSQLKPRLSGVQNWKGRDTRQQQVVKSS
jgi:hypothetical protein